MHANASKMVTTSTGKPGMEAIYTVALLLLLVFLLWIANFELWCL